MRGGDAVLLALHALGLKRALDLQGTFAICFNFIDNANHSVRQNIQTTKNNVHKCSQAAKA